MPLLVGLLGKKGSGKSTCANSISNNFGFEHMSFADGVKKVSAGRYSLNMNQLQAYKDLVDHRWGKTPRDIFREIGMEVRDVNPDYWVSYLANEMTKISRKNMYTNFVIDDVRFQNEADFIVKNGGYLIRIIRPDLVSDGHISETAGDDISVDLELTNDSDSKSLVLVMNNIIRDIIKTT